MAYEVDAFAQPCGRSIVWDTHGGMFMLRSMRLPETAMILITLTACLPGFAQTTTGTVTGFVTDAAAAPIADATVRLTNTGTAFAQTASSNETGSYVFPLVPPGSYQISIEKSGFQRYVRTFTLEVT